MTLAVPRTACAALIAISLVSGCAAADRDAAPAAPTPTPRTTITMSPELTDATLAAAAAGKNDELERLRARGADLSNARNENGITPLIIAAYAGHTETVRWLLAHGADPNVPNEDAETALHSSANAAQADVIVPLLVAAKANVRQRDKYGREPSRCRRKRADCAR
jgi:hypothetical protein